jgi:ankyrin repeat protein
MSFRTCWIPFLLCSVGFVQSAEISSRDVYQAIRQNDIARLESFLASGASVDLRDARGTTPLMHAAAIGSIEAMRTLMKAGADVNANNGLGATTLVWCASNPEKARLLIDAGAAVNVVTKMKRTPLMMAAGHAGSTETVRLLLAKGADASVEDVRGNTALLEAARSNDLEAVRMLLEHKVNIDAGDFAGLTALSHAAGHSNLPMMRMLLAKGANVNIALKREIKVRNGVIAASHITPLMASVGRSSPEAVKALLGAGADVNLRDVRGMTPLILSVASDVANPRIVRMLLDKGSDPSVKTKDGETALDWAKKFRNPRIVAMLGGHDPATKKPQVQNTAMSNVTSRQALERALPLLTSTSKEYFRMSGCAGCHHQHLMGVAIPAAARHGIAVDESFGKEQVQIMKSEGTGTREAVLQNVFISIDGLVGSMFGMGEQNYPADEVTDATVAAIAANQTIEGNWIHLPLGRPPLEDGSWAAAALAVRTLQRYGIPARKAEFDASIAKARTWFVKTKPDVPHERAFQVMGLAWSGAEASALTRAVTELRRLQRPDGGWPQLETLASDAYGTGVAMYALRQAGVAASDAAYQRGVRYLLSTQESDGSWHVASRTPKFQPYFQSGFPHNHDQWISTAATAWAVTVLAEAVEPVRQAMTVPR